MANSLIAPLKHIDELPCCFSGDGIKSHPFSVDYDEFGDFMVLTPNHNVGKTIILRYDDNLTVSVTHARLFVPKRLWICALRPDKNMMVIQTHSHPVIRCGDDMVPLIAISSRRISQNSNYDPLIEKQWTTLLFERFGFSYGWTVRSDFRDPISPELIARIGGAR
jgi:hypothetical protein